MTSLDRREALLRLTDDSGRSTISQAMRVLFVLPRTPFPPDTGFRQRYTNLLRGLAGRNEVAVACFATPEEASRSGETLQKLARFECVSPESPESGLGMMAAFLSPDPSEVALYRSARMAAVVDTLVPEFRPDLIVAGDPALTQYVASHKGVPRVLDYICDCMLSFERLKAISSVPGRWLNTLRRKKYAGFLRRIAHHYECCISSSKEDLDSIATAWPADCPILIIPVGLEPESYPLNLAEPVPGRMIYPGALSYSPNLDAVRFFARDILPRIRARVPNAELWVTGARLKNGLEPKAEGLHYTGYVDDIRTTLASAWATVVPLRSGAGGTRLKVLESMALGTPLVSTAIGYEGVAVEDRKHLLVAETAGEFAERCIELLGDADLRKRLAHNARMLLETQYNWRTIGANYESILKDIVERKTGTASKVGKTPSR